MIKKLFNKTFKKYSNFESKKKRKQQQYNELNTQINIESKEQDNSSNELINSLELNKIKSELNLICVNKSNTNDLIDSISTTELISSELNYNKMPCELIDHQINKMDKLTNDKIIDNFTNGVNISGISRRRILANIDYDTDTKFMCSTLLKDDDKNNSKFKFNTDECDSTKNVDLKILENNNQNSIRSNNKLNEFNLKKDNQLIENRFQSKKSLLNNEKSLSTHKTSTLLISKTNKQINKLDQDELIYDTRKPPFSDLSSIEEENKLDYLNNLKNNKFNSIDRRNNQYLNEFKSAKFDRNSNSNDLMNNNKIFNNNYFDNNQSFVSDYDSEIWYCKTKLYEDHIDEIIYKWENLSMDNEIWCKLICMERNRRIAKAYIRLPYLIVNGSKTGFDGYSIGISGFENDFRDNETKYIIKNLEKGVRIKIDENGNLIFKKMCQLTVHVKDWLQQLTVDGSGSLSDDIIALHGKLPYNQPIKVFDIERFANNLRLELEKPTPNRRAIARQCILPIVFGKNTYNLLNSPSWILICNIEGLRMIESMTKIPTPDYGLPTIDNNTLKEEEEEESSGSCSNNLSSDSMNSNSEEDNQFYSRFKRNRNSHIYSSI